MMPDPRRLEPMSPEEQTKLLDLFLFARDTCGYKDLTGFHLRWYQEFLRHQFLLLVSPRSHFKTSACIAYVLWRLVQNRNLRVLILSEVLSNAKDVLGAIKAHIASERFKELYGHWDSISEQWTAEKIVIPRDSILKESSINAAGILGTILSQHVDLLWIDDPQGEKNSVSPFQRKKVLNWLQKTTMPVLEPDGQCLLSMTRWNRDDLAGHIMGDPGFKNWKVIEQRAEWTDEHCRRMILFPERFPPKTLDRLRANMGPLAYRMQFLNDLSGQEDATFRIEWIESGRFDKAPEGLRIFIGVDLAIGEKRGASKFAYCVIGLDKAGTAFVLDAFRGQVGVVAQIGHAKRIHSVYTPVLIVAESTGYQGVFGQLLRVDPDARQMPLRMLSVTDPKEARIGGLAPLIESGAIRLPRPDFAKWVPLMEEEMLDFPNGDDDLLDALVLALRAVNTQRTEPRIYFSSELEGF